MKDLPYTLLEEIKDGQAISTKYDSKVLNFRKPNILKLYFQTRNLYSIEFPRIVEKFMILQKMNYVCEIVCVFNSYNVLVINNKVVLFVYISIKN